MKEWETYKIKAEPETVGTELDMVRHIVHVPDARRIIEDRKIKAGLVYDESRLNQSRVSVTWVSANDWVYGSIYGTVEFQFNWTPLPDIASRTSLAQQGGLSWSIQFCHRLASTRSSSCAGLRAGMLGWSPCRQAPGRWAAHIDAAADVAWAAGLRQRLAKIRSRLGRLACPTEAEAEQKQRTNAKRIAPGCGPPQSEADAPNIASL
jgi:hypothetical protein